MKRTAEERKQRRLETNRAAAKRSYYRRQIKMVAMKEENERLRQLSTHNAEKMRVYEMRVRVYEMLLQQLGVDPNAAMAAIMQQQQQQRQQQQLAQQQSQQMAAQAQQQQQAVEQAEQASETV